MFHHDTIAAIATPWGSGGVGIIRVSGPATEEIARQIFKPSHRDCSWISHHLYHGDIVSDDGRTVIDEVLIALMRKPHSFTGEDVLEINCHGSPLIMQAVLSQLIKLGCRPAKPGEFSQRAFLNGRIDLSQAEALSSIIAARSEKACAIGLAQLKGALSSELKDLRLLLIEALSLLEAAIDFTEEISAEDVRDIPQQIETVRQRLETLVGSYAAAKVYTEGMNIVITGKPNVGKSSLLNALTGKARAIVTDIPGTTRDFITGTITIRGVPINLTDTAGIRQPQNIIEQAGINLVWENLAHADLAVILFDGSRPLTPEDAEIAYGVAKKNCLVVINKTDLPASWDPDELKQLLPHDKIIKISAKFGLGISELKDAFLTCAGKDLSQHSDKVMITNMRHKLNLEKALACVQRAKNSLSAGMSPEFASCDLHDALDNLDEITGKKIHDEILEKIFSSFCIGK